MENSALTFATIVDNALELARPFIGILIGAALAYFIYGVAQFILSSGNEEKRAKGKTDMIWGVVALFCMVALWGLVNILVSTFDLGGALNVNTFI